MLDRCGVVRSKKEGSSSLVPIRYNGVGGQLCSLVLDQQRQHQTLDSMRSLLDLECLQEISLPAYHLTKSSREKVEGDWAWSRAGRIDTCKRAGSRWCFEALAKRGAVCLVHGQTEARV